MLRFINRKRRQKHISKPWTRSMYVLFHVIKYKPPKYRGPDFFLHQKKPAKLKAWPFNKESTQVRLAEQNIWDRRQINQESSWPPEINEYYIWSKAIRLKHFLLSGINVKPTNLRRYGKQKLKSCVKQQLFIFIFRYFAVWSWHLQDTDHYSHGACLAVSGFPFWDFVSGKNVHILLFCLWLHFYFLIWKFFRIKITLSV